MYCWRIEYALWLTKNSDLQVMQFSEKCENYTVQKWDFETQYIENKKEELYRRWLIYYSLVLFVWVQFFIILSYWQKVSSSMKTKKGSGELFVSLFEDYTQSTPAKYNALYFCAFANTMSRQLLYWVDMIIFR